MWSFTPAKFSLHLQMEFVEFGLNNNSRCEGYKLSQHPIDWCCGWFVGWNDKIERLENSQDFIAIWYEEDTL